MRSTIAFMLAVAIVPGLFAQALQTSAKYPLTAHIVSVEMEQQAIVINGVGGTSNWHLMKTEIDGKMYGLAAEQHPFHRPPTWLHEGAYPARRTKNGFDLEYIDSRGKVQHEELTIMSEE